MMEKRQSSESKFVRSTPVSCTVEAFFEADKSAYIISLSIDEDIAKQVPAAELQGKRRKSEQAIFELQSALEQVISTPSNTAGDVLSKMQLIRHLTGCDNSDDFTFSTVDRLIAAAAQELEAILGK